MKEVLEWFGQVGIYSAEEANTVFVPIRNRIFGTPGGGTHYSNNEIFADESWTEVIIRGALKGCDRTMQPCSRSRNDDEFLAWAKDDPRNELLPLLEILVEDGIDEIIHMSPYWKYPLSPSEFQEDDDAVTTRPTYTAICACRYDTITTLVQERLVFDRSGRWGFYGSEETFGLLGGEPEFMKRYIERAGGIEFIRNKADKYWQLAIDEDDYEANSVSHYYALAGWDNPPMKRG
jgi:hypothetical protein